MRSTRATATSAGLRPAPRHCRGLAGRGVDHGVPRGHRRVVAPDERAARLGPGRSRPHPTHRVEPDPGPPPGRRHHLGAGRAGPRSAIGHPRQPRGRRGQADLRQLRWPGRPVPRRPPRSHRGLLSQVPHDVLVLAQAEGGRSGRRPVRGGRRHRPRWAGLDLPRPGQERVGPLRGAEGAAELRRRRRLRGRDGRAPVPRRRAAPADRRDLQLRAPSGRRLHRHGVRRRSIAEADPQGARSRPTTGSTIRFPVDQAIAYIVEILPAFSTCTPTACCTATSSPTT